MPEFEVVCLANSRKKPGRCIAGIRTDGQGWVRPVSPTELNGALTYSERCLNTNSEPQILDVIRFSCDRHHPKPHHPEDWIITSTKWRLVRPASADYIALLRDLLIAGPTLFGDTGNRLPTTQFEAQPALSSLALVEPTDLLWNVNIANNGERKIRAEFSLGNTNYSLPLTDPLYEQRMSHLTQGRYARKAANIADNATVWMTISLGMPFKYDDQEEYFCYKLAAAVIVLPGGELSKIHRTQDKQPVVVPPWGVFLGDTEGWNDEDDERLAIMAQGGMRAEEIAKIMQRSDMDVRMRLSQLVME